MNLNWYMHIRLEIKIANPTLNLFHLLRHCIIYVFLQCLLYANAVVIYYLLGHTEVPGSMKK